MGGSTGLVELKWRRGGARRLGEGAQSGTAMGVTRRQTGPLCPAPEPACSHTTQLFYLPAENPCTSHKFCSLFNNKLTAKRGWLWEGSQVGWKGRGSQVDRPPPVHPPPGPHLAPNTRLSRPRQPPGGRAWGRVGVREMRACNRQGRCAPGCCVGLGAPGATVGMQSFKAATRKPKGRGREAVESPGRALLTWSQTSCRPRKYRCSGSAQSPPSAPPGDRPWGCGSAR